ncbi:pyridoxamine 5'-phosphate oxidase family protein [Tenggerimyces flavus]|uniref:Pyridoxamine 5'-phosphate oxidase family protein n=1 Tax=Tenggerimyces flavus TaxID=1708749 RepID=A0ABV7YIK5_9ACTN|nr:pyridoxamine 5'-phosphate oxidase family protein [Tenggerimyces flavus]MBM7787677.1 nitroimidazol reductase NimA-like FMN-containing flavoprotein (pyridoxamine 5'-phosphate oxidase superfamily) [Tenggerimyces flavus]
MTDDDWRAKAPEVVAANKYLVLSTVDASGAPWASPVYFANDGLDRFWWVSRPTSDHSRNLAGRSDVAFVIYDSTVEIGKGVAVYARGTAEQVDDADVETEIAYYSTRTVEHGIGAWTAADVRDPKELRLYRATVTGRWIKPADDGPDRRIELA